VFCDLCGKYFSVIKGHHQIFWGVIIPLMKNYFRVFGLGPEADSEEIKRAYRELAKKFHPDTTNEEGDTTAAFREITEAYEILASPESRAKYDRQRRQTFFSGAKTPGDRKPEHGSSTGFTLQKTAQVRPQPVYMWRQ